MGIFIDNENKFSVYDAPKSGGTTIRSWINFAGDGSTNLIFADGHYKPTDRHYYLLEKEWECYITDFFIKTDYERVAVKRDPVERFISCYSDKVIHEGHGSYSDIDDLIDNFYNMIDDKFKHPSNSKIGYLWYHFSHQVNHLGYDINYYDLIVDISQVNSILKEYLKQKWNMDLPEINTRKTNKKITLTENQIEKVKKIYKEDYQVGWC